MNNLYTKCKLLTTLMLVLLTIGVNGVCWSENNLAPKSIDFNIAFSLQLDIPLLRRVNSSEDFIRAAEYFNRELLNHDLTWDKLITLFEKFRADDKNPKYTSRIRNQRLNTVKNIFPNQTDIKNARQAVYEDGGVPGAHYDAFVSQLPMEKMAYSDIDQCMDLVFVAGYNIKDNTSYFITVASRLYTYIVSQQIFKDPSAPFESSWLHGAPGFDTIYSNVKGYQNCTYDGHHTFAWFLINYMLMNNGYKPLYLSPDDIKRISGHTYNYEKIYDEISRLLEKHFDGDGSLPDSSFWHQTAASG